MLVEEMGAHLLHHAAAVMLDPSAVGASEMELVVGVGQLPMRGRRAQAGLPDQTEIAQQPERPIDGGEVDPGVFSLHQLDDLLGGEMVVGVANHLPHRPPRIGHTVTGAAQAVIELEGLHVHFQLIANRSQLR